MPTPNLDFYLSKSFPGVEYVVATAVFGVIVIKLLGLLSPVEPEPFLDAKNNSKRQKVTLITKESLSHDVIRFRFQLPTPNTPFGLPSGKHIKVFGKCIALMCCSATHHSRPPHVRRHTSSGPVHRQLTELL